MTARGERLGRVAGMGTAGLRRAILRGDRTTRTAGETVTDFETLLYTEADGVAWVTLNRPQALNSFDNTMRAELAACGGTSRSNDDVRCVVLTGAGDRAFCVGIDRNAEDTYIVFERRHVLRHLEQLHVRRPGRRHRPQVQRPLEAGDLRGQRHGLRRRVLHARRVDFIIAAEHATFFDPHVTYGMSAVDEPMKLLQHISLGNVLRLSLLGAQERISAQTALQIGLVTEVVRRRRAARRRRLAGRGRGEPAAERLGGHAAGGLGRQRPRAARGGSMAPSILSTATDKDVMRQGNEAFANQPRITPRIR